MTKPLDATSPTGDVKEIVSPVDRAAAQQFTLRQKRMLHIMKGLLKSGTELISEIDVFIADADGAFSCAESIMEKLKNERPDLVAQIEAQANQAKDHDQAP